MPAPGRTFTSQGCYRGSRGRRGAAQDCGEGTPGPPPDSGGAPGLRGCAVEMVGVTGSHLHWRNRRAGMGWLGERPPQETQHIDPMQV